MSLALKNKLLKNTAYIHKSHFQQVPIFLHITKNSLLYLNAGRSRCPQFVRLSDKSSCNKQKHASAVQEKLCFYTPRVDASFCLQASPLVNTTRSPLENVEHLVRTRFLTSAQLKKQNQPANPFQSG